MKLITSNTTKGAYEGVLTELKSKLQEGDSCVVLTTDRMTATVERAILSSLDGKNGNCAFNLQVMSFTRLASKLLGNDVKKCLTPEGSVMLLAEVIEKNRAELRYYSKVRTDSFAPEMYAALTAIRNSGVSSASLYSSADKLPPAQKNKALDLALLYDGYLAALTEKYTDSTTRLEALAERINSLPALQEHYFVIDFPDYKAPELAVLREIALKASSFTVGAVSGEDNPNKRIYPEQTLQKLRTLTDDKPKESFYPENLSDEVRRTIEKYLFSYENLKKPVENKGKITLKAALTRRDEVLALALDIIKKVRAGARYRDFEVLLSVQEDYISAVKNVFMRYGIPFFIDRKEMLYEQTKVRYLLSALRLTAGGFSRSDVMELVKNPLFISSLDGETSLDKENKVFTFENYALEFGVNYGVFFKPFAYGKEEYRAVAEEVRKHLLSVIRPIDLSGERQLCEFVKGCRAFLDNCESEWREHVGRLSTMSAYYSKCAEQVDDKIESVLDELEEVMHGEMRAARFEEIFKSMLRTLKISLVPTFLDCVFVGDLTSRFTGGNDLYILGANSGAFPSDNPGGSVITTKDEELLSDIGVNLYPDERQKIRSSMFSIVELFKKARGKVWVSYADSSPSGLLRPSTVIAQLQSMLVEKGEPLEIERIVFDNLYTLNHDKKKELCTTLFSTEKSCYHEVLGAVGGEKNALEDIDVIDAAYAALTTSEEKQYAEKIAKLNQIPERLKYVPQLHHTSISRLETYFKCPYSYYLKYVLRLKPREEGELKTLDNGVIMHYVLERFFIGLRDGTVTADTAAEVARTAFDECVSADERLSRMILDADNGRLLLRLKAEAEKTCVDLYAISLRSQFRPMYLEADFGKGVFKPISVDANGKKIELVGKIDRVDVFDGKFVVIDYKTYRSADLTDSEVYYGNKLQLYIYAAAIRENLNLRPVGVFYFPVYPAFVKEGEDRYRLKGQLTNEPDVLTELDSLMTYRDNRSVLPISLDRGGKLSAKVHLPADEFEKKERYAVELAREGAKEVSEGYLKPLPLDDACTVCDFGDVCPYFKKLTRATESLDANAFDLDGALNKAVAESGGEDNA